MMNKVSPKVLLHSKWTKVSVQNKEKHFTIVDVEFDDTQNVITCITEAVINKKQYAIDWRSLKDATQWKVGWQ